MEESSRIAFDYLSNEFSLLNSQIQEVRIFHENEILNISISLKANHKVIEVLFEEILEYSFYYNDSYIFYNVEDYRFLYLSDKDEFYISFDPYTGTRLPSEKDGDLIRAKKLRILSN